MASWEIKGNSRCCIEEVIRDCEYSDIWDPNYSGYSSTIRQVSIMQDKENVDKTYTRPTARIAARDTFVR